MKRVLTDAELMDPGSVDLMPGETLCANQSAICGPTQAKTADTVNRTVSAFAQDSWQIRPNFTLNLGIRYYYGMTDIEIDDSGPGVFNRSFYAYAGIPIGVSKKAKKASQN